MQSGELAPEAALDWFLKQGVTMSRRALKGWVFETSELDRLAFPEELILDNGLTLSMAVSYYQPPAEPWGRYVVLVLMAVPATDI